MRNLKRLATSVVALVFVIAFSSCEKQPAADMQGEVSFNINNVTDNLKKGAVTNPYLDTLPTCSNAAPAYVMIGLNDDDAIRLDILTGLNGGNETQVMKFIIDPDSPEQIINSFLVYDGGGNLIWATPTEGSKFDLLWGLDGVDLPFTPVAFEKSSIDIDVLCWEEYSYKEFGFNWFEFHEVTVKTLCFFGDICTKFYDDFYGTVGSPYFKDGYVNETGNFDMPAIMSVIIKDAAGNVVNDTDNGMNNNWFHEDGTLWQGEGSPLCIEYPYFADEDQSLTFEIWLMYPDANSHLIYTSAPFMASAAQSAITGDDGVFDFVVGDCSYSENTTNIELAPYLVIPEELNASIVWNLPLPQGSSASYYSWDVTINSIVGGDNPLYPEELEIGNVVGAYCGDIFHTIGGTRDFKVYRTDGSYANDVPNEYLGYPLAQLNWLANQDNAILESGAQGNELQALVWLVIHKGDATTVAAQTTLKNKIQGYTNVDDTVYAQLMISADAVLTHTTFTPQAGDYTALLFDPIESSDQGMMQLLIVRVDP